MQHWLVGSQVTDASVSAIAASRLVHAIGSRNSSVLAAAMLDTVRASVAAHHCSILCFEAERKPRLLSAASLYNQWHVFNIASTYSRDHFRKDGIQAIIRRYPASFEAPSTFVHRQSSEEIEDPEYRATCYEEIDIVDRLAVLTQVSKTQWLSVHLYRDRNAGLYSQQDIDHVLGLAPFLASCAARHYAADVDGETVFRGAVTDELGELGPQLTTREREVLLRILDGVTTERIAEELHIRPTTVITYRTRAYEKLGVSSRRELFAAVLRQRNAEGRRWSEAHGQAA